MKKYLNKFVRYFYKELNLKEKLFTGKQFYDYIIKNNLYIRQKDGGFGVKGTHYLSEYAIDRALHMKDAKILLLLNGTNGEIIGNIFFDKIQLNNITVDSLSTIDINEKYRGRGFSTYLISIANKYITEKIVVSTDESREGAKCQLHKKWICCYMQNFILILWIYQ